MDRDSAPWISATRVWIPIAAALFTVALIVSAVVLPEIRFLHVLQALIYVAIVILARSNSMWAIGAGLTIAVVWNSHSLFVTHNMQRGVTVLWSLLQGSGTSFSSVLAWPLCSIDAMWVFAIASSVLWVWIFSADVSEDRQALLIWASAAIIIASSVVGLIAAWQQRRLTGG